MSWSSLRAAGGGATLLLASSAAHAQCTKDTDCKGDRVCEAGKCTSPVLPPAPPAPPGAPPAGALPPPAASEGEQAGAAPPAEGTPAPAPVTPAVVHLEEEATPGPRFAPLAATSPLPPDEPQFERRSRGLMIGGIVMASIGPVALLGALSARSSQEDCDESLESQYPNHMVPTFAKSELERCDSYTVPIYVLGIGGALLIGAGVPMIVYGAKQVPAKRAPQAQLVPWLNQSSAGLRLRVDL